MDEFRNEPTAWEDLGPTRQVQTYSPSYASAVKRAATDGEIETELMACLTLVAPAGMAPERRLDWLEVGRETVRHLPLDLLRAGCEEARKKADHPAKIVPEILKAAEPLLRMRREPDPYRAEPQRQIEAQRPTAKQIADILRSTGFTDVASKVEKGERK